ncbi:MAG: DUF427 domain-containing protein [Acidimicrobiales bacterium]
MRRPTRIEPGPGQESVWDYPRPPDLRACPARVRVVHRGVVVADTVEAVRVCETSHAPAYYLPRRDITPGALRPSPGRSVCEWKGVAVYWAVTAGDEVVEQAAWSYEDPVDAFSAIRGHVAFYAQRVEECWVGDERVSPNGGDFYGGWITSAVVGPFKGDPGTQWW